MITKRLSSGNDIRVMVVTSAEQFMHALAIRAICFMEDTGLTAAQAIDGNDYQATHIVVYDDQEPIGAARIRWFRDFAKIERTAFRRAYRNPRILKRSAEFIFDHVSRKGYQVLVTHAEPKYARLWKMLLGFEQVLGRPSVVTEGHEPYLELVRKLSPPPDAITLQSPPTLLFRIEGQWDTPGAFESSSNV
jgi:hypothetical protein